MTYDELLCRLESTGIDKNERLQVLKAFNDLFASPPDPHPCGDDYMVRTDPDNEICLLCGKEFVIFDDLDEKGGLL